MQYTETKILTRLTVTYNPYVFLSLKLEVLQDKHTEDIKLDFRINHKLALRSFEYPEMGWTD